MKRFPISVACLSLVVIVAASAKGEEPDYEAQAAKALKTQIVEVLADKKHMMDELQLRLRNAKSGKVDPKAHPHAIQFDNVFLSKEEKEAKVAEFQKQLDGIDEEVKEYRKSGRPPMPIIATSWKAQPNNFGYMPADTRVVSVSGNRITITGGGVTLLVDGLDVTKFSADTDFNYRQPLILLQRPAKRGDTCLAHTLDWDRVSELFRQASSQASKH